jgi:hypothetical protein
MSDDNPARRKYLTCLREIVALYFNEGELRTLCFDLGVDYDDLPGKGKTEKAKDLVEYLEHRGRISELVEIGQQLRPNVSWGTAPPVSGSPVRSQSSAGGSQTQVNLQNDGTGNTVIAAGRDVVQGVTTESIEKLADTLIQKMVKREKSQNVNQGVTSESIEKLADTLIKKMTSQDMTSQDSES